MKFRRYLKPNSSDTYGSAAIKNILHLSNLNLSNSLINDIIRYYPLQNLGHYINVFESLGVQYNVVQSSLTDLSGFDNFMLVVSKTKIILIHGINDEWVNVFDAENGWEKKHVSEFEAESKVIILDLYYKVNAAKHISTYVRNNKLTTIIVSAMVIISAFAIVSPSLLSSGIFAIAFIFSMLTIWESKAQLNSISFCDLSHSQSCATVINSKYGKPFGLSISLAAAVFYSSGFLISLLLTNESLWVLKVMSNVSLLTTMYLLIVQAFVIRVFCTLCLTLSVLNFLLFFHINAYQITPLNLDQNWILIAVLILTSFGVVQVLKRLIEDHMNSENNNVRLKYFINAFPFKKMLLERPVLELNQFENSEIFYGNPSGSIKIDLFISLSCEKCRLALNDARKIVQLSKKIKLSVNIVSVNDPVAEKRFQYLAAARIAKGNEYCIKLLDEYAKSGFFSSYSFKTLKSEAENLIECHVSNSEKNNVRLVPSLAINQRLLGKEFSLTDLTFYVCQPEN